MASHQKLFVVEVVVYVHNSYKSKNNSKCTVSSPNASMFADILHILPNIKREKEKACARDKKLT